MDFRCQKPERNNNLARLVGCMPIIRGGRVIGGGKLARAARSAVEARRAAGGLILPQDEKEFAVAAEKGRRAAGRRDSWNFESTSLARISEILHVDLVGTVRALQKPVVVDWGCGYGDAVRELAKDCPHARCFGFSKENYEPWRQLTRDHPNLAFVHGHAGQFKRYFRRGGKGTVDLIYSHGGLGHVGGSASRVPSSGVAHWEQRGMNLLKRYINEEIVPALKVGGRLIVENVTVISEGSLDEFLKDNPKIRVHRGLGVLTVEKLAD